MVEWDYCQYCHHLDQPCPYYCTALNNSKRTLLQDAFKEVLVVCFAIAGIRCLVASFIHLHFHPKIPVYVLQADAE